MAGCTQPILALHWVFLLPDPLSLESSGYLLLLPEGSMSSPPTKYWAGAFLLGSSIPHDSIIALMTLGIDSRLQGPPPPHPTPLLESNCRLPLKSQSQS